MGRWVSDRNILATALVRRRRSLQPNVPSFP